MPNPANPLDPRNEAEWMFHSIIDDFAQSLNAASRARFYKGLMDMIAGRLRPEENGFGADPEPGSSQHIQ